MEPARRGGDGSLPTRGLWLPRRCDPAAAHTSSSSSITSGTTLSTAYTSGSSHLQSSDGVGEAGHGLDPDPDGVGEAGHGLDLDPRRVRALVFKFAGGDAGVLERWLSELDAGWVLHLPGHDASRGWTLRQLQHFVGRWSRALHAITVSVCGAFSKHNGREEINLEDVHLLTARFIEATHLKMLFPFVTAVCSMGTTETDDGWASVTPAEKLQALIDLAPTLDTTLLRLSLHLEVIPLYYESIHKAAGLLDEAIWDTVYKIRLGVMCSTDGWGAQKSPDVHKLTQSVTKCITQLWAYWDLGFVIVRKAGKRGSLILQMVSCLEAKLAQECQSFPDDSIRFLFLLNNTNFIWQQLRSCSDLGTLVIGLTCKIDDYMQRYLQVSWAPVLSCLHDNGPASLCLSLGRFSLSPLLKFESEFQKTYSAQKLWKVPDPNLRRKLREAIIEKVTSGLTEHLDHNNISTSGFTTQELEEMLQELFEG